MDDVNVLNENSWAFKLRTSLRIPKALCLPWILWDSWAFKLRTSLRSNTCYMQLELQRAIPEHSSLGLHWGKYLCRQNGWQKNIPEHSSLGLHWGRTLSAKLAEEGYIPEHSSLGLHWGWWVHRVEKTVETDSWAFKLRTSLRNQIRGHMAQCCGNSWAFKLRTSLRIITVAWRFHNLRDSWAFKLRTSLRIQLMLFRIDHNQDNARILAHFRIPALT